ncbi:hypothetical protein HZS_7040 [Henneguya salminicola]|nr:hypothetical protein HZS_7040 [Henneguya salminicola]
MIENTTVEEIRRISSNYIKNGDFESGIFWLEKICILTNYYSHDLYIYVMSLMRTECHNCALAILKKHDNGNYWIQIVMANCYSAIENCSNAIESLSTLIVQNNDFTSLIKMIDKIKEESPFLNPYEFISDALHHKATLLEYSGHTESTLYYSYSLICCPMKFSSARKLFEDGLLTYIEISCIIKEIQKFNNITNYLQEDLLKYVLKFYNSFIDLHSNIFEGIFAKSWDVRRWKAQQYLNCKNPSKSLEITKLIMKESSNQNILSAIVHSIALFQNLDDSLLQLFCVEFSQISSANYFSKSILLFIKSLKYVSEGKSNDAHATIQKAVASNWNAVICMQPWSMSPSLLWMLQGHASWNCGDNENALASFVAAADCTPGLIWPWFCIGILHVRHNHFNLALPYLLKAYKISDKYFTYVSPIIINEIAFCLYNKKKYLKAKALLEKTISHNFVSKLDSVGINCYLPIFYLNLAHCCLKMNELNIALKYSQQGLSYNLTCTSLMRLNGYLKDLVGEHEAAQLMYHRSLFLSPQLLDLIPKNTAKTYDYTFLPPDANYRMYRQHDIFCCEMLKWSSNVQNSIKESNK